MGFRRPPLGLEEAAASAAAAAAAAAAAFVETMEAIEAIEAMEKSEKIEWDEDVLDCPDACVNRGEIKEAGKAIVDEGAAIEAIPEEAPEAATIRLRLKGNLSCR